MSLPQRITGFTREVFKASEKLDSEAVLGCLQGFGQLDLHHLRSEKPDLHLRGFLRMISVLERSFTPDRYAFYLFLEPMLPMSCQPFKRSVFSNV